MKRPLAVAGFTMLGTLLVFSKYNNAKAMGITLAVTLIAFLVFLCAKPLRKYSAVLLSLFIIGISICYLFIADSHYEKSVSQYENKTVEISGTLCELPYTDYGRYYYVIKTNEINFNKEKLCIRLVSDEPLELEPTDTVTVNAWVFKLGSNGDSYLDYYKSRNLFLGAKVRNPNEAIINERSHITPSSLLLSLRYRLSKEITDSVGGDEGAVICAVLLGDKSSLSDKCETDFRNCGISHLFSVSGFHLSLWAFLFFGFLKKLRLKEKQAGVFAVAFCVFFMLLTGFNPPVVRAGFMLICVFAASLFEREADSLNSIGLALLVMLVINPYTALSVSLWLSLLSTLAIINYSLPLSQKLFRPFENIENRQVKTLINYFLSLVSVTLCATVATVPVNVFVFGSMSVMGLASNVLMIFVGSVCMFVSGIAAVLLSLGISAVGNSSLWLCGKMSSLLINTADYLAGFRFSLINVGSFASKLTVVLSIAVFAAFLIVKPERKRLTLIASLVCILAFVSVNAYMFVGSFGTPCVYLCQSETGIGALASYKGRSVIVYDGISSFESSSVKNEANRLGISNVDMLIASPNSKTDDINRLAETLRVKEIVYTDNEERSISLGSGEYAAQLDENSVSLIFNQTKIVFLFSDDIIVDNSEADFVIDKEYISSLEDDKLLYITKDGIVDGNA